MEMKFYHEDIKESFLNDFIKDFKNLNISTNILISPDNEKYCCDDVLINILKVNNQFDNFQRITNDQILLPIDKELTCIYDSKFIYFLQNKFPNSSIVKSGSFLYPKTGYMGWHTNANSPYLRCYITYSENGDSYFKYRDPDTKQIIIDKDNIGWTLRYFKISAEIDKLFWHCVYSNTTRISYGFKIKS